MIYFAITFISTLYDSHGFLHSTCGHVKYSRDSRKMVHFTQHEGKRNWCLDIDWICKEMCEYPTSFWGWESLSGHLWGTVDNVGNALDMVVFCVILWMYQNFPSLKYCWITHTFLCISNQYPDPNYAYLHAVSASLNSSMIKVFGDSNVRGRSFSSRLLTLTARLLSNTSCSLIDRAFCIDIVSERKVDWRHMTAKTVLCRLNRNALFNRHQHILKSFLLVTYKPNAKLLPALHHGVYWVAAHKSIKYVTTHPRHLNDGEPVRQLQPLHQYLPTSSATAPWLGARHARRVTWACSSQMGCTSTVSGELLYSHQHSMDLRV